MGLPIGRPADVHGSRSDLGSADLPDDLDWILDKARTRRVAQLLRSSGSCQGLIVPSVGALDQTARWNVVVFADQREIVDRVVGTPELDGRVLLGAPAPA